MRPRSSSNQVLVAHLTESYVAKEVASPTQLKSFSSINSNRILRQTSRRESVLVVLIGCLLAGVVAGLGAIVAAPFVFAATILLFFLALKGRVRTRRREIDRDLPPLLTAVASSVRAGVDPIKAILDSQEYLPSASPLCEAVKLLEQQLSAGEEELRSIERLLSEDAHRDVELFKQCIVLSRRHGSPLSDPLHRVVRVVRQRQSFVRKTRAALAMHTMSSFGIVLCALLIGLLQICMNPLGVRTALADPRGVLLLSAGGSLIVIGVLWMSRMGREEAI